MGAPSPKYHLITFATDAYADKARDLLESGRVVGGFDVMRVYGPGFIDDDFKQRNAWAFAAKPDANYGYYIWKPYILFRHMMERAAPGDVVCYCDSLYMFIADARPLIDGWTRDFPHVALTANTPYHCLFMEEDWTKRDAMALMGVESECRDCVERFEKSPQLSAGFVCVRKGFKGMSFVSEWLTYCQDRRIVSDDDDVVSRRCRPPSYHHNRHDQTVLSLLGKKWRIPFRTFRSGVLHNLRRHSCDPAIDARAQEVLRLINANDQRVFMEESRPEKQPSTVVFPGQNARDKLAIIMTLYDEMPHAELWHAFFKGSNPSNVNLYIHQVTPNKSLLPYGFGARLVPTHPSGYGTMEHWRLYNHLLSHALADDAENRRFVFVSQACIPVRPFNDVYALAFANEKSKFARFADNDISMHRLGHLITRNKIARCNLDKAEAWCMLTRKHADVFVKDEFKIITLFDDGNNGIWYPGEHIYPTYLRHIGLANEMENGGPTYTQWQHLPQSTLTTFSTINEDDMQQIISHRYWFARKFVKSCVVKLLNGTDRSLHDYLFTMVT